jgi:hypothetical protein
MLGNVDPVNKTTVSILGMVEGCRFDSFPRLDLWIGSTLPSISVNLLSDLLI